MSRGPGINEKSFANGDEWVFEIGHDQLLRLLQLRIEVVKV